MSNYKKRQEMLARTEFNELAKNLHHLASTHCTPGVYNPPYSKTKPTAFDIEIETHLKSTFHVYILVFFIYFNRLIINGNLQKNQIISELQIIHQSFRII